jgi:putative copper resistance protein D
MEGDRGWQRACLGVVVLAVVALGLFPGSGAVAQHAAMEHDSNHGDAVESQRARDHRHETAVSPGQWEGSPQGVAYSEFNHHLAGAAVVLMGLSELRRARALPFLAWTRFLLPVAMLGVSAFLLIWSDHEAWPVGHLSLRETFFGGDFEMLQHKTYALLLLAVGLIELRRRLGHFAHSAWTVPLPVFAIVGGLMLFGHSHGPHPAADKIAMHHALMGALAITAGSTKLVSGWRTPRDQSRSGWETAWALLILVIGLQLVIYSE